LEGYDDGFGDKTYVPPDFKAIRTSDGRTYIDYETGEREMYDLRTDPRQLRSLHDEPERAVEQAALSTRLQALKYCSGKGCQDAEKPNPRPRCTPRPPWRDLSPPVSPSFIQLGVKPGEALLDVGVGSFGDRGIRRQYPGSCIRTSENSYKVKFREFAYFGSTSAGR
jgi:hypothetical protein